MSKNLMDFYVDILRGYLDINDVVFLQSLDYKKEQVDEEIKKTTEKKETIIKKIDRDQNVLTKDTKEYRDYMETTESVLESTKLVLKNLDELNNEYESVEKSFGQIIEKYDLNSSLNELKIEIDELKQKINFAILLEQKVKNDNEKNYLIINSFKEDFLNNNLKLDEEISFYDLNDKNLKDNRVLKICKKRVELPYTKREVQEFMKKYPEEYKTVQDVIIKEFMIHIDVFKKHPILARFKEAYYLCRTKEMMSIFDSFSYAKNLMFRADINPYIIAAVKSKKQLQDYIKCLEENRLNEYPHFKIIFEINPIVV